MAKANRRRLDDQRGLTIRNLDLPEFLLPKEPAEDRPASSLGFSEAEKNRRNEEAKQRLTEVGIEEKRPMSTPPRSVLPLRESGFMTGTIPSHEEADAVFGGLQAMGNVTFGESLGSSGYPDSLTNTARSLGDDGVLEEYSIPDPDQSHPYNHKVSGVSISSQLNLPTSPGFDLDVTLTSQNVGDLAPPPAPTPGPDVTLQVGLADYSPPTPLADNNREQYHGPTNVKAMSYRNTNNNHLKTLYEESSSETPKPPRAISSSKPRVAKKPDVAPKPSAEHNMHPPMKMNLSPPPKRGMLTVVGTDGRTHRATFV